MGLQSSSVLEEEEYSRQLVQQEQGSFDTIGVYKKYVWYGALLTVGCGVSKYSERFQTDVRLFNI